MKNHLSIYLIKKQFSDVKNIFRKTPKILHEFSNNKILYYDPSIIKKPSWLDNFFNLSNDKLLLANSRAVLIIKLQFEDDQRIFALTFGHGKYMLAESVVEERFGLITLLNLISEDDIKKITKTNIGGNLKTSDEQIPKSSNINEFGFDINRDLMKKVTAIINNDKWGKCVITGGDIFTYTIESSISSIEKDLEYLYGKYQSKKYKKRFSWIDNINPVKDKKLIEELDKLFLEAYNNNEHDKAWLAIPEMINMENTSGFQYSGSGKIVYDDIDVSIFTQIHGSISDIDQFKNKRIYLVSAETDSQYQAWSAYKCAFAEIDYKDKSYCLNDGKWFNIHNDFVKEINDDYDSTKISKINLQNYSNVHKDEGDYNIKTAKAIEGAICLDQKNIMYGGGSNRIEVCDIFTDNKQLIHIKHNGGSSYLSHLFNQAANSGELLTDPKFQVSLKNKFEELGLLSYYDSNFDPKNYTVILGIIDKHINELPHIPFFSKVSIQYAKRRLSAFGYKVEIKNILNKKEEFNIEQ